MNYPNRIPELLTLCEAFDQTSIDDLDDITCKGVDCSGLLYYVANGWTPRNTSQLISYGEGVSIDNLSALQLSARAKPLDLIVWKGHVMITLSDQKLIESRLGHGVMIHPFVHRVEEMQQQLQTEKNPYYLRRWHKEMFV